VGLVQRKYQEKKACDSNNNNNNNNNNNGHCTHTTESTNVKYKTYFAGEITLYIAQIVNTEQNICNSIYPRNIVCFRYIIVNTLHRADNKDDDDNNNNNNSYDHKFKSRV